MTIRSLVPDLSGIDVAGIAQKDIVPAPATEQQEQIDVSGHWNTPPYTYFAKVATKNLAMPPNMAGHLASHFHSSEFGGLQSFNSTFSQSPGNSCFVLLSEWSESSHIHPLDSKLYGDAKGI